MALLCAKFWGRLNREGLFQVKAPEQDVAVENPILYVPLDVPHTPWERDRPSGLSLQSGPSGIEPSEVGQPVEKLAEEEVEGVEVLERAEEVVAERSEMQLQEVASLSLEEHPRRDPPTRNYSPNQV